jgi:uncharacterized membrane protein
VGTFLLILHVAAAVFLVGPMAILPMTAMRALRTGQAGQVAGLAVSTRLLALLSILVVVLGFGVMGTADPRFHLTILTPWILASLICWAIAMAIDLGLVVPTLRRAAEALGSGSGEPSRYPAVAAGSGIASLLLLAVVVLMVWRP